MHKPIKNFRYILIKCVNIKYQLNRRYSFYDPGVSSGRKTRNKRFQHLPHVSICIKAFISFMIFLKLLYKIFNIVLYNKIEISFRGHYPAKYNMGEEFK